MDRGSLVDELVRQFDGLGSGFHCREMETCLPIVRLIIQRRRPQKFLNDGWIQAEYGQFQNDLIGD